MTDIVERLNACSPLTIALAHEAADYIEKLRAEIEEVYEEGFEKGFQEAASEIERLREALKPFADQAAEFDSPVDGFKGDVPDDYYQECSHHTIGDLRAARKALEPKP